MAFTCFQIRYFSLSPSISIMDVRALEKESRGKGEVEKDEIRVKFMLGINICEGN